MKKAIQLQLTTAEKQLLKEQKISIKSLINLAPDEIASIIKANAKRTREIGALIEFQSIPSLGIGFALELIEQGYYSLTQLKGKTAVELFDAYEKHVNAWADPCVEDSYRLLVHYIEHKDESKRWWDFTAERKAYRKQYGFPADRPVKPWYELNKYVKS
ncbi:helix-hairpin-helix domain-containing protein [Mucilaginibacter aquaedulcis]|uniref:helix-hairpin-helix domain-containing protein n=1 Tax=Mucilaginibacter aquaedulcis TaxID=1187081 RepID=UPI0025B40B05|nr:helix-hairpin-helix domain-containing protein [Mucilaginibacter aquaedulcis]MDN3547661.1 helix-hairpin-helix domain-containing protein [Mucilaginibacter aquaedulcis]